MIRSHHSKLPPEERRRQRRDAAEYALRERLGAVGREIFQANALCRTARAAWRAALEGPEARSPEKARLLRATAYACIVRTIEALRRAADGVLPEDRIDQTRLNAEIDHMEVETEDRDSGLGDDVAVRIAGMEFHDHGDGLLQLGDENDN